MVCTLDITVRFGDTDPYGVVYFAAYLRWAHAGVEELLRNSGLAPEETFRSAEPRFGLPVVEVTGRFLAPARYGEALRVTVGLDSMEEKAVTFRCLFDRPSDGTAIAEATISCVAISADWKSIRIPDRVRERLAEEGRRDLTEA